MGTQSAGKARQERGQEEHEHRLVCNDRHHENFSSGRNFTFLLLLAFFFIPYIFFLVLTISFFLLRFIT
jgi:hypothetical protein